MFPYQCTPLQCIPKLAMGDTTHPQMVGLRHRVSHVKFLFHCHTFFLLASIERSSRSVLVDPGSISQSPACKLWRGLAQIVDRTIPSSPIHRSTRWFPHRKKLPYRDEAIPRWWNQLQRNQTKMSQRFSCVGNTSSCLQQCLSFDHLTLRTSNLRTFVILNSWPLPRSKLAPVIVHVHVSIPSSCL